MVYVQDWHHLGDDMRRFAEIAGPHCRRWHSLSISTLFIKHLPRRFTSSARKTGSGILWRYGRGDRVPDPRRHTEPAAPGTVRDCHEVELNRSKCLLKIYPSRVYSGLTFKTQEMQQLRQILTSSPRLRSITLRDLEDPVGAEGFSAEAIALKSLCVLDISNIGKHILVGIAKMLQVETLVSLIATVTIPPGSDVSHLANILRPSSKDSPLLRNRRLNSVYVKISGKSCKPRDSLTTRLVVGYEVLLLLGSADRGYDIDLDTTECRLGDKELIRVLRIIDPFALRIGRQYVLSVTAALSNNPASPETWFCPNLQHLHLQGDPYNIGIITKGLLSKDRFVGMGAATGRPRLLVYDSNGRVHNPKAVSVKHSGRTRDGTCDHQNVE